LARVGHGDIGAVFPKGLFKRLLVVLFHAEAIILECVVNAQIICHRGHKPSGRCLSGLGGERRCGSEQRHNAGDQRTPQICEKTLEYAHE
jgi:hypothetical protein